MICKLIHKNEIHLNSKVQDFHSLKAFVYKSFSKLPKDIDITYVDDEGDEITISNDYDIEALKLTSLNSIKFIKLQIKEATHSTATSIEAAENSFEEVRFEEEKEQLAREVAREHLKKMNARVYEELAREDEQEMMHEAFRSYKERFDRRVVEAVHRDEQEQIQTLAKLAVAEIGYKALQQIAKIEKAQEEKIDTSRLNSLVDERIKLMLPVIVEKVSAFLEGSQKYKSNDSSEDESNEIELLEARLAYLKKKQQFLCKSSKCRYL